MKVSPLLLEGANKKRIKLSFSVEMFNCLFHNAAFVSESQSLQSRLQTVSIGLFQSCLLHRNYLIVIFCSVNTMQKQVFVSKSVPMRKSSGDLLHDINLKKKKRKKKKLYKP